MGLVHGEAGDVSAQFHRQVGPARHVYRQFLRAGLPQGHQAQYDETVDQRFVGDERFLEDIQRKTDAKYEVTVGRAHGAIGPVPSGGGVDDGDLHRPCGLGGLSA